MSGRFGKYGDNKRKARLRRSGNFGKKNIKITPPRRKTQRPKRKETGTTE